MENKILGSSVKLITENINSNELRFEKTDKNESWGSLSNESILNFLGITDRKIYKIKFYDEKYIGSELKIWLCPLDWNPTEKEPFYNKKDIDFTKGMVYQFNSRNKII